MATILVQQLDANNDPVEAGDGAVFIADLAAVAQIIGQRLRFFQGEWWENLSLGFPMVPTSNSTNLSLIGSSGSQKSQQATLLLIQQQILSSPYVLSIPSFAFSHDSGTRASIFSCKVETAFGTLLVTNAPGLAGQVTS